jgi:hypothetical protein
MVLSTSKMARNASSICNRGNTCGGVKKAGLGPTTGFFLSSMRGQLLRTPQSIPLICCPNYTVQTQKYGYSATHGGNMG